MDWYRLAFICAAGIVLFGIIIATCQVMLLWKKYPRGFIRMFQGCMFIAMFSWCLFAFLSPLLRISFILFIPFSLLLVLCIFIPYFMFYSKKQLRKKT